MIRLALHGGAGDPAAGHDDTAYRQALREFADEGAALLSGGASALDVVEQMVVRLEDCPLFNSGIGAVLNCDGQPELDAAIMSGDGGRCGAVAGVSRTRSPIRLARAVMERTPHVLFMGDGADALGRELGLPEVTPDFFVTEERFRQLKEAHRKGVITLDHDSFGTVGAVARDRQGHLAAATSTGGLTNKRRGRVGDTPLIGVGTWADDATAALSCTGTGESFIRAVFAHRVHAQMAFAGWDLQRACEDALAAVRSDGGRGGCIAIDRDGNIAMPFNSRSMYRAWSGADGQVRVAVQAGETLRQAGAGPIR